MVHCMVYQWSFYDVIKRLSKHTKDYFGSDSLNLERNPLSRQQFQVVFIRTNLDLGTNILISCVVFYQKDLWEFSHNIDIIR